MKKKKKKRNEGRNHTSQLMHLQSLEDLLLCSSSSLYLTLVYTGIETLNSLHDKRSVNALAFPLSILVTRTRRASCRVFQPSSWLATFSLSNRRNQTRPAQYKTTLSRQVNWSFMYRMKKCCHVNLVHLCLLFSLDPPPPLISHTLSVFSFQPPFSYILIGNTFVSRHILWETLIFFTTSTNRRY